jgi:uncharacterized protein (DUF1778 family)
MPTAAKTSRRNLRVSPTDDDLFRQAAAAIGASVSEFLVESGRERAEMILADRTQFVLDEDAWQAFMAALDRPAEVKPAVVELLRRSRPE